jgi:hypothetical protein
MGSPEAHGEPGGEEDARGLPHEPKHHAKANCAPRSIAQGLVVEGNARVRKREQGHHEVAHPRVERALEQVERRLGAARHIFEAPLRRILAVGVAGGAARPVFLEEGKDSRFEAVAVDFGAGGCQQPEDSAGDGGRVQQMRGFAGGAEAAACRAQEAAQLDDAMNRSLNQGLGIAAAVASPSASPPASSSPARSSVPPRRMADASKRIAEGRYDRRVETDGPPEFARLAARFNQMAGSLESVEHRRVWMGRQDLSAALRPGDIELTGEAWLVRAFPRWLRLSPVSPAVSRGAVWLTRRQRLRQLLPGSSGRSRGTRRGARARRSR